MAAVALLSTFHARAGDKPAVAKGDKVIPFEAKTTAGNAVKFPDDYKGKVVLLDFWATWCGPCRAELPHVVDAYKKLHDQGFEVLGVSLDKNGAEQALGKFTEDHHMPWPQIFDGKLGDEELAAKFNIHTIPCPILIDGDTGMVVAKGWGARGSKLTAVVEKLLAGKKAK
jgi:thiol-disulfide isomerase/thioredoxin